MKLYTERQMKEMFRMGLAHSTNEDGALGQFASIELPSDEEIGEHAIFTFVNRHNQMVWVFGATWMRDKIGGNNEQL